MKTKMSIIITATLAVSGIVATGVQAMAGNSSCSAYCAVDGNEQGFRDVTPLSGSGSNSDYVLALLNASCTKKEGHELYYLTFLGGGTTILSDAPATVENSCMQTDRSVVPLNAEVTAVSQVASADDFPLSQDLEKECQQAIAQNYFDSSTVTGFDKIVGLKYDAGLTRDLSNGAQNEFGWIVILSQKNHPELTTNDLVVTQLQHGKCVYVVPNRGGPNT